MLRLYVYGKLDDSVSKRKRQSGVHYRCIPRWKSFGLIVLFMVILREFLLELFFLASSTVLRLHCLLKQSLITHHGSFFPFMMSSLARSVWLKHSSLTSRSCLLKIFISDIFQKVSLWVIVCIIILRIGHSSLSQKQTKKPTFK